MYHALLTNRYLTSRVIPLIAVAAVALCVALVIIVVSVMTGFLNMVKSSGRTLMGDVVVSYPVSGIPYYDRLIQEIERLPEAAAATPVVDTWGLLKMPYPEGPNKQTETVQIWGIEPIGFARVTGYEKTLNWRDVSDDQWLRLFNEVLARYWEDALASLSDDQKARLIHAALSLDAPPTYVPPSIESVRAGLSETSPEQWRQVFRALRHDPKVIRDLMNDQQWQGLLAHDSRLVDSNRILQDGLTLQQGGDPAKPGIVLGMHVSEGNERQKDGTYRAKAFGHWWMPRFEVTLTTLPISGGGLEDTPESRILPVLNEFVSGVYLIDDKRVMVPLHVAQELTHLDDGEIVDEDDPSKTLGVDPARATLVLVRAVEGVTPEQLREAVAGAYDRFATAVAQDPQAVVQPPPAADGFAGGANIQTWAQQQASFIGPVEKEREMMRTLFSMVYLVCAGLVLAIFWAIVHEKTRDIGILRSVGASRMGISWIFLRYGLVVGVLGAIAGLGLGYLVVRKINTIHEALGNPPLSLAIGILAAAALTLIVTVVRSATGRFLPLVLGGLIFSVLTIVGLLALRLWQIGGFIMWDPSVYYFSQIPNQIDVQNAVITMIGAVIFSVIGAFVPAAKAADTDPVQALRYE